MKVLSRLWNISTGEDIWFQGINRLDCLQQASDEWFGGAKVTNFTVDDDGKVTLLRATSTGESNVIGVVYRGKLPSDMSALALQVEAPQQNNRG